MSIANTLGVSRSTAHGYVQRHWHALMAETLESLASLRDLELARLEALHRHWNSIAFSEDLIIFEESGDSLVPVCNLKTLETQLKATEVLLKVSARRSRILGLDGYGPPCESSNMPSKWKSLREIAPDLIGVNAILESLASKASTSRPTPQNSQMPHKSAKNGKG